VGACGLGNAAWTPTTTPSGWQVQAYASGPDSDPGFIHVELSLSPPLPSIGVDFGLALLWQRDGFGVPCPGRKEQALSLTISQLGKQFGIRRYPNFNSWPASSSMADPSMAQSKVFQGMLRTVLVAAGCASSCVVQGGEENREPDPTAVVGVVRFEAKNQAGAIVGSGCLLIDNGREGERIRFRAASGDRIELTERNEMIREDRTVWAQHAGDEAYWCSKTNGKPYNPAIDARCLKTVSGKTTRACLVETDWAGKVSSAELIPADAGLDSGKVQGFRLQIDVLGQGEQCALWQCGDENPLSATVAFVIEKP